MKPADNPPAAPPNAPTNSPSLAQSAPSLVGHPCWTAAVAVVLVAGLFAGGTQPVAVGLFDAPWDKVVHASLFGVIAMLVAVSKARPSWRWLLASMVIATGIGALDELHQIYLPGRSADWADLLADFVGASGGAGLVGLLAAWLRPGMHIAST